jgi:hypothetical protein
MITVAWPCEVVSVKVPPLTDAIVPFAPRRWNCEVCVVSVDVGVAVAVGVVVGGIVDVVCEDVDEHATMTIDKAAAKVMLVQTVIMFLRFILIYIYLPWYS